MAPLGHCPGGIADTSCGIFELNKDQFFDKALQQSYPWVADTAFA
jgi:hypothetical protein